MKIGITCYPTYGGSGVVATELGIELAARGHEIHFISYAMPIRLSEAHETHPFPRSRSHLLPALRPPALHSRARHQNVRSRRTSKTRPAPRALRHPALRQRHARPNDGPAAPPAVYHHAPRHRHHSRPAATAATCPSPNFPSRKVTASLPSPPISAISPIANLISSAPSKSSRTS